jgi:hypothetical protein
MTRTLQRSISFVVIGFTADERDDDFSLFEDWSKWPVDLLENSVIT